MRVRVRGFLTFRPIVGAQEVELDEGARLRTLLDRLAHQSDSARALVYSPKDGLRPGVAVLINGRHHTHTPSGLDTLLSDGDSVEVFPPLAGG